MLTQAIKEPTLGRPRTNEMIARYVSPIEVQMVE